MHSEGKLNVVLCWHMHQPPYQDEQDGQYKLPWTYLHAIKDYVDMAAHLEACPDAKCVVNFSPTLLEQIDDYSRQSKRYLEDRTPVTDPILSALVTGEFPTDPGKRTTLIKACLKANEERAIARYEAFQQLVSLIGNVENLERRSIYLSNQFLSDLLVWYHLVWIGETVRHKDPRIKYLIKKSSLYSFDDRNLLFTVISELLSGLIGRYRKLAERGQAELSFTPYSHPIMPLLLDFNSARQAWPDITLPQADHYPGGLERSHWQVEKGIDCFERHFGFKPSGCWPAEGAVSTPTLELLAEHGIKWAASGENVLNNSLRPEDKALDEKDWLYLPYRISDTELHSFFRDDGLSDLIGFEYARWHGDDAVANLISHLDTIATRSKDNPDRIVSIILDGENAWETYPYNGYYFLSALYKHLAIHPSINLTTYGEYLKTKRQSPVLKEVTAGSWVHGTFSTWIGDPGKNRAWDLLCEAKQAFDEEKISGRLTGEALNQAEHELAICEASDWAWWFGDYNPEGAVSDFDSMYRRHLTNLYRRLDRPIPESVTKVISHGSGDPATGGVMRTGQDFSR
ncbi:MAG: glycoside hydrolase family 57 protein [Candidatus Sedimenticola sp. (ex Thyasira tokunagai)]